MIKILSKKPITLEEARSLGLFFVRKDHQVFISNSVSFGKSMVRMTNISSNESILIKGSDLENLELFTGEVSINIEQ